MRNDAVRVLASTAVAASNGVALTCTPLRKKISAARSEFGSNPIDVPESAALEFFSG
jgi:hypothetical protein